MWTKTFIPDPVKGPEMKLIRALFPSTTADCDSGITQELIVSKCHDGSTVFIFRYKRRFYLCELTIAGGMPYHGGPYAYIAPLTKSDFKKLLQNEIGIGDVLSNNLIVTDGQRGWTGYKTIWQGPCSNELCSIGMVHWQDDARKAAEDLLANWTKRRTKPKEKTC